MRLRLLPTFLTAFFTADAFSGSLNPRNQVRWHHGCSRRVTDSHDGESSRTWVAQANGCWLVPVLIPRPPSKENGPKYWPSSTLCGLI